jgi:recombination protein RecA
MAEPKTIADYMKDGIIKKGNDPSLRYERVPTGISPLDDLLGGGIPTGRNILLYGYESTGKTLLAQYIAAAIQKTKKPKVIYIDNEGTYDEDWWKKSSVDTEELLHTMPVTAEDTINMMGDLLNDPSVGLFILDSIPGMVPAIVVNPKRGAEQPTVGGNAHLITLMYQKLEHRIITSGAVLLSLNQMLD